jgi:hypothetical protein
MKSAAVLPLLLVSLLLVLAALVHTSRAAGAASAVCDAEGECRPLAMAAEVAQTQSSGEGGGNLKDAVEALVAWVAAAHQQDNAADNDDLLALLERWTAPEVVVEAEGTPNVPWRGRFVGRRSTATFLRRLRRGLSATTTGTTNATTTNARSELRWSTSASGTGIGVVVQWEPSSSPECGAWLMAWSDGDVSSGRLARLSLDHTRALACAAAHRTRAQRAFDGAFAHFFRKDYAAFRTSFAPDLVLTWHGDAVRDECRCLRRDGHEPNKADSTNAVCRLCVCASRWARCSTAMARRG